MLWDPCLLYSIRTCIEVGVGAPPQRPFTTFSFICLTLPRSRSPLERSPPKKLDTRERKSIRSPANPQSQAQQGASVPPTPLPLLPASSGSSAGGAQVPPGWCTCSSAGLLTPREVLASPLYRRVHHPPLSVAGAHAVHADEGVSVSPRRRCGAVYTSNGTPKRNNTASGTINPLNKGCTGQARPGGEGAVWGTRCRHRRGCCCTGAKAKHTNRQRKTEDITLLLERAKRAAGNATCKAGPKTTGT